MSEKAPPSHVMQRATDADLKRVAMRRYRRGNALIGLALLTGVVGVYAYSMLAVKQETFLDDEFDRAGSSSNTRTAK